MSIIGKLLNKQKKKKHVRAMTAQKIQGKLHLLVSCLLVSGSFDSPRSTLQQELGRSNFIEGKERHMLSSKPPRTKPIGV